MDSLEFTQFENHPAVYFLNWMDPLKLYPVSLLWRHLAMTCRPIKSYFYTNYRTSKEFENFFKSSPQEFFFENGHVAIYDQVYEDLREDAVNYFKRKMEDYDDTPEYMRFRGHLGQAPKEIINFINIVYPGRSFKKFLKSYSDVFVVFKDDTVNLIEDEVVGYFEDILEDFGNGMWYKSLRGHIGQAEQHVQQYINSKYPGEQFIDFLLDNSDVFDVQGNEVFLA